MSDTPVPQPRWSDPALTPAERADALLAALTLDDKVNLVMSNTAALAHLGIPALERVDASCGLRGDTGVTAFPIPLALSATFDADLAYAYGAAIGAEARAHGWSIILGPTVDVERRGNSGRAPEGFGEDPRLNGLIGERVSRGMQDQHLITCLKHFTAYTQEFDRNSLDVRVSERALHELYNAPFELAIRQGSALSIMGSYPRVNGAFACENAALMDQLRSETGWPGFMMSDFMAGQDPVAGFNAGMDSTALYPGFQRDAFFDGRIAERRLNLAAQRTLYAIFASGLYDHPVGALDQAKPVSTAAHKALARRVAQQSVVLLKNRENALPLSRQRIRRVAVIGCARRDAITGAEGSSYVNPGDYNTPLAAMARAAGENVRVTFAQGTRGDHPLPIVPDTALRTPDDKSNGLLGAFYANADFSGDPVSTQVMPTLDFSKAPVPGLPGGWSARWTGTIVAPVSGLVSFTVLCSGTVKVYVGGQLAVAGFRDGINFVTGAYHYPLHGQARMRAGEATAIVVEFSTHASPLHNFFGKHLHLGWSTEQLLPDAIAAAADADAAVVFVNQAAGEGMDRSFELPADQNQLIEAVCAANSNTIVVLNTPGAVLLPWIERAAAVLQAWYPGEAIGTALADVLFGDADPGGRLPVTFPAAEAQTLPPYAGGGRIELSEEVFVGYRHYQRHAHAPQFAFGHGLSYAQFEYADAEIIAAAQPDEAARVRVTVRNCGARPGGDVVQVYAGAWPAPVAMPRKQLAGFARVALDAGEAATLEIAIPRRSLSYWDASAGAWKMATGAVTLYVGASSADDRLPLTLAL